MAFIVKYKQILLSLQLAQFTAKKSDNRYQDEWPKGELTVQAEAIPPDQLQELFREAIKDEMDLDELEATREKEVEIRSELKDRLGGLEPLEDLEDFEDWMT